MVPRHPGDVWRSVRDAVPPTDDTYAGFDEWFERAARGDPEGLAALWRQYQPLLLRYFRGRLPDVAEDLASTVWIDVASSLASFRGDEDGFRGWLFTIEPADNAVVTPRTLPVSRVVWGMLTLVW